MLCVYWRYGNGEAMCKIYQNVYNFLYKCNDLQTTQWQTGIFQLLYACIFSFLLTSKKKNLTLTQKKTLLIVYSK